MFTVARENSFDFMSQEYADLFARSDASAFQHPAFLAGIYGNLAKAAGAEALVVVVRSEPDKRLEMVLPLLCRRHAGVRLVEFADLGVVDYAAPVVSGETFARIAADSGAVDRVARAVGPHDLLRIDKLLPDAVALEAMFGGSVREETGTNCYAAPLAETYEAWRGECLDRSYAKELNKKRRQLDRRGAVDFICAREPDEVRRIFEAMREFRHVRYAAQSEGDLMRREAYYRFYLDVALAAAGGDFGRTYALRVDEKPVACAFTLAHAGRTLIILNGFDEADYGRQSVGSQMFQEIARDCIARGDRILDFTIGDEPYKLTFGGQPRPMLRIAGAATVKGRAAQLAVEKSPFVKAAARRLLRGG